MTRQDNTWQARHNKIRQGKTQQDKTRQGKTRQDRTRQTFVVFHGPSVIPKPHAGKLYVVFCFIRQIHDGPLISFKLEPRSYVFYLSGEFLFWRAWHLKCRIRQFCVNCVQQLLAASLRFEDGRTRYFSGRTNSWEISPFSAEKKKLLLLKTEKIPRAV